MKLVKILAAIFAVSSLTAQASTLVTVDTIEKASLVKMAELNLKETMTVATLDLFSNKIDVQAALTSNEQEVQSPVNLTVLAD